LTKAIDSEKFESDDEKIGFKILTSALDVPLRLIARNAGAKADVVIDTVLSNSGAYGYDALDNKFVDMLKAGIVDPAKVTRSALVNAASVGSMLLTTEAAVVDIPEEKPAAPAMPPMGGMGGMM
jgi:chaperonin GroEL